jgi:hypothetical protein
MQYVNNVDIWTLRDKYASAWVVIPTNVTRRKDGTAVMGAGLAKEAARKYPSLPEKLGKHIVKFGANIYVDRPIICLPTKVHWKNPSLMSHIEHGCLQLSELSRVLSSIGNEDVILIPRLGCGLGGLNWEREVRPVVDSILTEDRFVLVSNE